MFTQVTVNFYYNIGDKIYFVDEFNSVHQGKIIALCHGPLITSKLEEKIETTICNYYIIDSDDRQAKRVYGRYEESPVRLYVPENKIFYSLKALTNYITANIDHIQCIFFKPEEKKENNDN